MTAIITDVHYRMSLALIRDLGERGVRTLCCERADERYPLGFFSKYCSETRTLPPDDYENALYKLCKACAETDGEKPALLPVGAKTLALLAENLVRERFSRVAGFCLPTKAQLDLFNDKTAVAALAKSLGVPTPDAYEPPYEKVVFPCVVKPACGEKFGLPAEKRYAIARTRAEMHSQIEHFKALTGETPVVQKYLRGGGLGCSVLCKDGAVVSSICHRRLREYPISGGPSTCCVAIHDERLRSYVEAMVKATGYTGLAMFEFKEDDKGNAYLLEVNPRIWGTFPLTRVARSGLSYAWYRLSLGLQPEKEDGYAEKRMTFTLSDLAAAASYLKKGYRSQCWSALGDLLNPAVRDGLFEWKDMRPALRYFRSLLPGGTAHGV